MDNNCSILPYGVYVWGVVQCLCRHVQLYVQADGHVLICTKTKGQH